MKHRILLADDSPHAQRMGERILREEGFEVVSVTDGETALVRLRDFNPDLVIADVSLPLRSGYDVCKHVKSNHNQRFTKVVLTAGLLEPFSHDNAREAGSDGILRKPFEASVMLEIVQTLIEASEFARKMFPKGEAEPAPASAPAVVAPVAFEPLAAAKPILVPQPAPARVVQIAPKVMTEPVPQPVPIPVAEPGQAPQPQLQIDRGLVRASVTLAMEGLLPKLIDEITDRVVESISQVQNQSNTP